MDRREWLARHGERYIVAVKLRRKGHTFREIGEFFGRFQQTAQAMVLRGERILARLDNVKPKFRAHKARIDATQPDDPPRGVWIEK